jgi:acyl-CoA reductase-like NAD-dependent aldehyde dehydrogenase
VICNISAWNYPYNVGVNVFVPALLSGNAVLYKPSEYSTLTGLKIEQYLKQAGVPDEIFQIAIGAGETGNYLLDLPFDGYYFTGSYKTGKYIYERVAHKMVPCQLELGGKDPVYVADDIGMLKQQQLGLLMVLFTIMAKLLCCRANYVHEDIFDAFVKELVAEVQSWKIGSPETAGTYISVLSRSTQAAFLENQINDALSKGARVLTGGKRIHQKDIILNQLF